MRFLTSFIQDHYEDYFGIGGTQLEAHSANDHIIFPGCRWSKWGGPGCVYSCHASTVLKYL